jgi:hypothetical protein
MGKSFGEPTLDIPRGEMYFDINKQGVKCSEAFNIHDRKIGREFVHHLFPLEV